MRILFDQGTPVPIRSYLAGHVVFTAAQCGWDRLANGDLLNSAEENGFHVLVTTDKNLRYQQNLATRKIAIVVLGLQQWPELRPHVDLIVSAVKRRVARKLHRSRYTAPQVIAWTNVPPTRSRS